MTTTGPQDNPQNHDRVDAPGVDKPSQAEGDEGDFDTTAADATD
ncbi:hypothetical protein [Marisediminicola sp. LYQ134]